MSNLATPSGRLLVNFEGSVNPVFPHKIRIPTENFSHFRITCVSTDQNYTTTLRYSADGINLISSPGFTFGPTPESAGVYTTQIHQCLARYIDFEFTTAAFSTKCYIQIFFFDQLSAAAIKNLGAATRLYDEAALGVKTLRSSDASLTFDTSTPGEIDVTVTTVATVPMYAAFYSGIYTTNAGFSRTINGADPGTAVNTGEFSYSSGVITYTGTETKDFVFTWSGTVIHDSTSATPGTINVRRNDANLGTDYGFISFGINNVEHPCSITTIVTLAQNNNIRVTLTSGITNPSLFTDVYNNNYTIRSV